MNPAWALLRLASPQLPIGGYSYSQGLELAVDSGRVTDIDSARRWIGDQLLLNLARFEAPLLLAHCRAALAADWEGLAQLAAEQRASRETRELYQESRQMGIPCSNCSMVCLNWTTLHVIFWRAMTSRTWPSAGRWRPGPGRSVPKMPWPPGCGAGWKISWPS